MKSIKYRYEGLAREERTLLYIQNIRADSSVHNSIFSCQRYMPNLHFRKNDDSLSSSCAE